MSRYGKRPKSSQIPSVLQRKQRKGDDDEEDSFFMDVPAEEERSVRAECQRCCESMWCRMQEELDQSRDLGSEGENEGHAGTDVGEDGESCVAD